MTKITFLAPEGFDGIDRQNLTAGLSTRFRFVVRKNSPVIYDKETRILSIFFNKSGNYGDGEITDAISDFINGFFCGLNK